MYSYQHSTYTKLVRLVLDQIVKAAKLIYFWVVVFFCFACGCDYEQKYLFEASGFRQEDQVVW